MERSLSAAAGFAATVANFLFAPSAAPSFSFVAILGNESKKRSTGAFFGPFTTFQNLQNFPFKQKKPFLKWKGFQRLLQVLNLRHMD